MEIPIPDDWDGEAWQCFTVMWPNSPQWRSLLRGLILSPAKGRFWDGNTGSIRAVQAIGLQIDVRNLPLKTCEGLIVPCREPALEWGGPWDLDQLCFGACEDDDMPCTDCPPIKIEDGQLWWFNCGEWQSLGDIGGIAQPEIETPWPNDDQGNPPTLSACGRATAVHAAVVAIADGFKDNILELPWRWVGNVEATVPGYDLKNLWVVDGILNMVNLLALYEENEIFDAFKLSSVLCRMVTVFGADQESITDAQFSALKQAYISEFGLILAQPYTFALNALGRSSVSQIAKMGATDTASDCGCPEYIPPSQETEPDANGWYWGEPLGDFDVFVPADNVSHVAFTWQTVKEVFAVKYDVTVDTSLNFKSMSMPTGSGINQATGDTSENFPGTSPGPNYTNMFVHKESSFKTAVLGAGVGTLVGGAAATFISTDPANPSGVGLTNVHCGYAVRYTFNGPGWLHFTNVRLLHNINSAHGAQG